MNGWMVRSCRGNISLGDGTMIGTWRKWLSVHTVLVLSACGGNTTSTPPAGAGTSPEDLEASAPTRCAESCDFLAQCGGMPASSKCVADCESAIHEVLNQMPMCKDLLISVLDCTRGTSCSGHAECDAKSRELKSCESANRSVEPPPVVRDQ